MGGRRSPVRASSSSTRTHRRSATTLSTGPDSQRSGPILDAGRTGDVEHSSAPDRLLAAALPEDEAVAGAAPARRGGGGRSPARPARSPSLRAPGRGPGARRSDVREVGAPSGHRWSSASRTAREASTRVVKVQRPGLHDARRRGPGRRGRPRPGSAQPGGQDRWRRDLVQALDGGCGPAGRRLRTATRSPAASGPPVSVPVDGPAALRREDPVDPQPRSVVVGRRGRRRTRSSRASPQIVEPLTRDGAHGHDQAPARNVPATCSVTSS